MMKRYVLTLFLSILLILAVDGAKVFAQEAELADDETPSTGQTSRSDEQVVADDEEVVADDEETPSEVTSGLNAEDLTISFDEGRYKYLSIPPDVDTEELIQRTKTNTMYLYDYRYQRAVKTRDIGKRFFITGAVGTIIFGAGAIATSTLISDDKLSTQLTVPLSVIASGLGFGGIIPGLVMWNIGSSRQQNIIRDFYDYPDKIRLFDLYEDEDTNYLEE